MKRFAFTVAVIVFSSALVLYASAQENGERAREVKNGNTTIVFEPANGQDLNLDELRAFSQIANDDPGMAKALAKNPKLIDSESFVSKHPGLQPFLSRYPRAKEDFLADPGNFVVPVAGSKWSKAAKGATTRHEMR
ncbi:MAG: hypothetical protein ABSD31_16085 [Candidatus Binataceae bacterium]|jgi:hypothetical protein